MSFLIPNAYAAAPQAAAGGGIEFLIIIVIFFALMYFIMIRPQNKRTKEHKQLIESLSRGDEVITTGGVVGKITQVGENMIQIEVANGIEIKIQKQAITSVLPKGTIKSL